MTRLSSVHLRGRDMAVVLGVLVGVTWTGWVAGIAAAAVVVVMLLVLGRRRPRVGGPRLGIDVAGSRVRVVEFRGYVYFDAVKRLLAEVTGGALGAGTEVVGFVVLDLRGAIGAERAAAASLARLQRLLGGRGVVVVYAGMGATLQRLLARAGCEFAAPGGHVAADLRRALEWCDEQGLAYAGDMQMFERFQAATGDRWLLPQLLRRCEVRALAAGSVVLRGDDDAVQFVERGALSAWQDLGDGDRLLLRTFGPGALVRGSVLASGSERPVVVVCDTEARVHRLSAEALAQLRESDPFLVAGLERLMTGMAGTRTAPRGVSRGRGVVHGLNSSAGLYRDAAATYGRAGRG